MEIIKEKTVAIAGSHTAEILSGKNDTNLLNVLFTETSAGCFTLPTRFQNIPLRYVGRF